MKFKNVAKWMREMMGMHDMEFSSVSISYRKNRRTRPTELCHLLSMRVPQSISEQYGNCKVAMFHVKTNDRGKYIVKIMLED